MRIITGTAIYAAATLALASSSAEARTVDIGKKSAAEVKSFCDGVSGGKFTQSPEGNSYGCSAECTGGTCNLLCDKDTGCDVSIPERRVPRGRDLRLDTFVALSPDLQVDEEQHDRDFPLGLLGLLGLAGLLGLRGHADRPTAA